MRGRFVFAVLVAVLAATAVVYAAQASGLSLATCTDNFTGPSGGDWGTAANWTSAVTPGTHQVPSSNDVACWGAGTTVVVTTSSQTADSIQGGSLQVASGTLNLTSSTDDSSLTGLTLTGGSFNGPTGRTLQLDGDFDWNATSTTSGFDNGSGGMALVQTASHNFTIRGSQQETFAGGAITTPNPVAISNVAFYGTSPATLTATSNTISFTSAGSYGGSGLTLNADGIITQGGAVNLPYTLDLHGSSSSLAGDLSLNALNTDASTLLTVPTADHLSVGQGSINGTVAGPGTYSQAGSTTTVAGGGTLSTDQVSVPAGTLSVTGAYSAAHATSVTGGNLQLNSGGSTGDLTLTNGNLYGAGGSTLTIGGNFDWDSTTGSSGLNSTGNSGLALVQAASHSFKIEGSAQALFYGGSITTPNPVSITNTGLATSGSPSLSATGAGNKITFGSGSYQGSGLTLNADGLVTTGGAVSLPYSLHLTGNASSLGGDVSLSVLNTDTSTSLTVPANDHLSVGQGTINGTVTGPGTFTQTASTTMIAAGGTLSTDHVTLAAGTLVDAGTYSAASATSLTGGNLQLNNDAATGNLTVANGNLYGSSAVTLSINGNFDWNTTSGGSGINSTGSGAIALVQAPSHSFKIEGSAQQLLYGGSITTPNPVTITNPNFAASGSPTLSATGAGNTITFGSGSYQGSGLTLSADGIATSAGSVNLPYTVHVTGSASQLGGDLSVSTLNTDSATSLIVPTGDHLNAGNGAINGTITGPGTYTQTGGSTTVAGAGTLSTDHVVVAGGTLTGNGGYSTAAATQVTGGNLLLNTGGSTGDLTLINGNLSGSGGNTLTISGNFDWNTTSGSSGINTFGTAALGLVQTGSGSFKIEGSSQELFYGGSITTPNPVSVGNAGFSASGSSTLTAQGSTVSFSVPGSYGGSGLTINAAGINTAAGATTLPYTLDLTGGSTSVPTGSTLAAAAVNLSAGTLQVDGNLNSPVTLNGSGTLKGGGTVSGKVTNTNGTVAPGDSPGALSIGNGYSQSAGGTLAIPVNGTTSAQYSKLAVTGNVSLDGTLALQPNSAYAAAAQPGDTIGFLTYSGSLTGTFGTTSVNPPLSNAESFKPDYGSAGVIHAVVGNGTPDTTAPSSTVSSPTYARNITIPVQYGDTDPGTGSGVASLALWVKGPADSSYSLAKTITNPPATGTISYTSGEGDGNYSFYTVATDNANNVEATPSSPETVTRLDTTAPQVTISAPTDGGQYTQGAAVNTNYGCTDPGGSGIASCSGPGASGSPLDTSALGTHSFTVDASDNAGNTTSRTVTYTVVAAPAPPTATTGGVHDLTATSATLLGIVDPNGAETTYWFEYGTDQSYGHTTSPQDAGSQNAFSAASDVSALQPSTLYHYRLVAQQGNGTAVDGADQTFTTPALPAPTNTEAPLISGTAQVNQTLTALTGGWSGNPSSYSFQWLACDTNGASCQNISTNGTGQHFDVTSAQLGDTIRVQVKAINAGGTSSAAQSDATDPVVAPASSGGGGGTADVQPPSSTASSPTYAGNDLTINYAASDPSPSSGLARVELWVKGPSDQFFQKGPTDSSPPANGQGSFAFTATEGNGSYAFYTRAVDQAGNTEAEKSSPDSITVVDTHAPTSNATVASQYAATRSLTVSYTASDPSPGDSDVARVQLWVKAPGSQSYSLANAAQIITRTPVENGSFAYNAAADGQYSFYTLATDQAGNAEASKSTPDTTVSVDTVAPTATFSPLFGQPANATSNSNIIQYSYLGSDPAPSSGLHDVTLWEKGPRDSGYLPATVLGPTGQDASPRFGSSGSSLQTEGDGLYSFYATATDFAGNSSAVPSSPQMTVLIDTTRPTIAESEPTISSVYARGQQVNAAYSCSDSGSGIAGCSAPVSSGSPLDTSTAGSHVFSVAAIDNAGNTNSEVGTYYVDTPPVIVGPTTATSASDGTTEEIKSTATPDGHSPDTRWTLQYWTGQTAKKSISGGLDLSGNIDTHNFNVTPNQTYSYTLTVSNVAGTTTSDVATFVAGSAPSTPTGLAATTKSASEIDLSWNAVSGATSYNVLRATASGGPFTQVGTPTGASFADTGLNASTTYYYVVQATNAAGVSPNSSPASATTSGASSGCSGAAADRTSGARAAATAPSGSNGDYFMSIAGTDYQVLAFAPPQTLGSANGSQQYQNQSNNVFGLNVLQCSSADRTLTAWAQQVVTGVVHRQTMAVSLDKPDATGQETVFEQWKFQNAFPSKMTTCPLREQQSNVCVNQYTFSYTAVQVTQGSGAVSNSSTGTASGGWGIVTVGCTASKPCNGSATIAAGAGTIARVLARSLKVLGSTHFRIKAHHRSTLRIHLNAYGRRLLNRSPSHRLAVNLIIHMAGTSKSLDSKRRIVLLAKRHG